ncbi:hypothetical protein [Actinomyces oris]|jgi:hypothetical protein
MPDVTGWPEEEILDYENGLAVQESPSSPLREAYLDAYRIAAIRSIDEGLGTQWLRDEERKLRSLYLAELTAYSAQECDAAGTADTGH